MAGTGHPGRLLAAALAVLALAISGCAVGSDPIEPGDRAGPISPPTVPGFDAIRAGERMQMPRSVAMGRIGDEENTVYVLRRVNAPKNQPLLIWFHGYGTHHVGSQERWLTHMTRKATVVFPSYVRFPYPVGERFGQLAWPIAARALRQALRRLDYNPDTVIVGGYSLGSALANDYAVNWREEGLPRPAGLYSVFGGRKTKAGRQYLPTQEGKLSPMTEVVVVASTNDLLAGAREARRMFRQVPRGTPHRIILIRDFEFGDHFAPTRVTRGEQRIFWLPLDRLINRVERRAAQKAKAQAG